jgi:uncharacterized protein YecA (UPF0149 family)
VGDIRTGEINSLDNFRARMGEEEFERFIKPVDIATLSPYARHMLERTGSAKIGRNDACLCGSGKKFKRCCMQLPEPVEPKIGVLG